MSHPRQPSRGSTHSLPSYPKKGWSRSKTPWPVSNWRKIVTHPALSSLSSEGKTLPLTWLWTSMGHLTTSGKYHLLMFVLLPKQPLFFCPMLLRYSKATNLCYFRLLGFPENLTFGIFVEFWRQNFLECLICLGDFSLVFTLCWVLNPHTLFVT